MMFRATMCPITHLSLLMNLMMQESGERQCKGKYQHKEMEMMGRKKEGLNPEETDDQRMERLAKWSKGGANEGQGNAHRRMERMGYMVHILHDTGSCHTSVNPSTAHTHSHKLTPTQTHWEQEWRESDNASDEPIE